MVETDSKQIYDTVTPEGVSEYFVLCAFLSHIAGCGHLLQYCFDHWSCLEKQALAPSDTTFSWFPALVFRLLNEIYLILLLYFILSCQIAYLIKCGSEVEVKGARSCPTLCDPMDYTAHGILQDRVLEWVAFPFFRGSSQSRGWTQVSHVAGGFFTK